jgi:hypothetical protein
LPGYVELHTAELKVGKFESATIHHYSCQRLDHRMVVSESVAYAALSGSKSFKPPALPVVTD